MQRYPHIPNESKTVKTGIDNLPCYNLRCFQSLQVAEWILMQSLHCYDSLSVQCLNIHNKSYTQNENDDLAFMLL